MKKKLFYIAEIDLPSSSAYSIQVLKMCDAFSSEGFDVTLFFMAKKKNISYKKIKNIYNLKNKINFYQILNNNNNSFISRFYFFFKIKIILDNESDYAIYSRSIITAFFLLLLNKKIILELHHNLKGFSFYISKILFFKKIRKNIFFIFINKNLINLFSYSDIKYFILDDAVELDDFKIYKDSKITYKNTCVYCGSLTKGKGLDLIREISVLIKNIKFHVYGDTRFVKIKSYKKYKNIKFLGYKPYREIPKILSKYQVLLMPYASKVYARSKNLEISNYMSPLKLFEYLASSRIILASKMRVYSHILKNNYNAILIKNSEPEIWSDFIKKIFLKPKKFSYLRNNAYKTVFNNTWNLRARKIITKIEFNT